MIRENEMNTQEEEMTFLKKKQNSNSSSSTFQNSPRRTTLRKKISSELSSMLSTKDLNSSFDDFTTFDGLNDHDHSPLYHGSLFAQSIFYNSKDQDDPFELEQSNQNCLFFDSHTSSEQDQEDEEANFQFLNFSNKLIDNCFEAFPEIPPLSIIEDQAISDNLQKVTKQFQFKITKKGRKKKSTKPRKINKALPPKIKCCHCNCSNVFYTDKQHSRHHNKFSPLCTKDTVILIKLIARAKRIIHHLYSSQSSDDYKLKSIKEKYESFVKFVSQKDHFNYISGSQFEDCLTEDDDDENFTDYKSRQE